MSAHFLLTDFPARGYHHNIMFMLLIKERDGGGRREGSHERTGQSDQQESRNSSIITKEVVKGDLENPRLHAATAAMLQAAAYSNATAETAAGGGRGRVENKENIHVEGRSMLYCFTRGDPVGGCWLNLVHLTGAGREAEIETENFMYTTVEGMFVLYCLTAKGAPSTSLALHDRICPSPPECAFGV